MNQVHRFSSFMIHITPTSQGLRCQVKGMHHTLNLRGTPNHPWLFDQINWLFKGIQEKSYQSTIWEPELPTDMESGAKNVGKDNGRKDSCCFLGHSLEFISSGHLPFSIWASWANAGWLTCSYIRSLPRKQQKSSINEKKEKRRNQFCHLLHNRRSSLYRLV